MSNLTNYYKGWPKSGKYFDKLNEIQDLLYNYLIHFPKTGKKYTVIFDIDDTLVYTDHQNLFPNKKFPNKWVPGYMVFPGIPQMVEIARLCKKLGFKVIIITARPYQSESSSKKNLEILNISYDEMYHNDKYPDINFKIGLKEKLSKTHNIILSVGDQWPDLQGLTGCLCIKLPNHNDSSAYFTFNNDNYYRI